jgi:hypothetical protein
MTRFTFAAIAAVLALSFAASTSAQATGHETAACPMPAGASNTGALPAPTAAALPAGCETTTRPWSAPVGHRQPQSADITSLAVSSFDRAVAEENARVDQAIKGVCRGC